MRKLGFNQKNLFVYLFIFFILFYLFFRFGIQTIMDLAFFLTSRNTKTETKILKNNTKSNGLIIEPYLLDLPHATNAAEIIINGKASSDNQIDLYQNDEKIQEGTADYDGNFNFILNLEKKDNEVYIRSVDPYSKKSLQSTIYKIIYILEPPKLEVKEPSDGKKYYQSDLIVSGQTEKEVFIKINGQNIVVRADGSFSSQVTLNNGENNFKIEAIDVAGNSVVKEIKVTYVQ